MMKYIYLKTLVFSLFLANLTFAQNCPNRPANMIAGAMSVSSGIACVGVPITVSSTNSLITNVRYTYNLITLADTSKSVTTTSNTYTTPGRYLVVQTGRLSGQRTFSCAVITVVARPIITFSVTSCGNATARLTINNVATLPYSSYQINWGDGTATQTWTSTQPVPVHTYPNSTRAYTIQVAGVINGANCAGTSTPQSFTPVGTPPAIPNWVSAEVIDNTTVEMVFQMPQVTNSSFTLQQRIFPSTTFTNVTAPNFTNLANNQVRSRVTGLQTNNNAYLYRLTFNTQCSGSNIAITSQEIALVSASVTPTNYQNLVAWRPFTATGLTNFSVLRDGEIVYTTPNATTFLYTDTKVNCAQKYTYQVIANFDGRTPVVKSASQKITVTTMPTALPPPLSNVSVNVKNAVANEIRYIAPLTTTRVDEYAILGSNNTSFMTYKTIINDSLAKPSEQSVCYTVSYFDICNRRPKDSIVVCSMHLEARGETLKWTPESPIGGKISTTSMGTTTQTTITTNGYTVERLDNQGRVIRSYNVAMNTEWDMDLTDSNQDAIYRIRARNATNTTTAVSNIVNTYRPMKVYVPDAFSPNGDRTNEKFVVQGVFVKDFKITIVNRTGQPIFQSTSIKDSWDGTIDNQPARYGTYGYIIEATDTKGKIEVLRGTLQLIR